MRFRIGRFGNLVLQGSVLRPDDRIALVPQLVKVLVVDPHVLGELELTDETGADHERGDPPFDAVVGRAFRQRRAVGRAPPDHPPPVHVGSRVPRVHPAAMGAERNGIAQRVHLLVVEIVVPLHIGAEHRIILLGGQYQRRAAAPPAHELGGDELLLLGRLPVLGAETPGTCRRVPPAGGRPCSCRSGTTPPVAAAGREDRSHRDSPG